MQNCYGRFAELYDLLMDDVNYDRWADSVAGLLRAYGAGNGAAVIDCACGTGALTVRLAERGFRMTGMDGSEDMLRAAQDKCRGRGLFIPLARMDLTDFSIHRPADAVTCCCDGVNYLTDEDQVRAFFVSANRNLKAGGLLLFDISTPYKLEKILGSNCMGEDREECTYLWENLYDPETELLEMRLHFFVPDGKGTYGRFDEIHLQRAYTTERIGALLAESGFDLLEANEAFTGKAPVPETERIQYAARKKGTIG